MIRGVVAYYPDDFCTPWPAFIFDYSRNAQKIMVLPLRQIHTKTHRPAHWVQTRDIVIVPINRCDVLENHAWHYPLTQPYLPAHFQRIPEPL